MVIVAEALQLLVSLVSGTTPLSSEHASKKYVPLGNVDGTVTEALPLDVVAGASEGTDRLPVRRMLVRLFEVVVDR
jgi:hypothetical protein